MMASKELGKRKYNPKGNILIGFIPVYAGYLDSLPDNQYIAFSRCMKVSGNVQETEDWAYDG